MYVTITVFAPECQTLFELSCVGRRTAEISALPEGVTLIKTSLGKKVLGALGIKLAINESY